MGRTISLLLLITVIPIGSAFAQTLSEGEIAVIQPRPVLVQQRAEIIPRFGATFNDPLISQFLGGGSLYYHISEVISLGGTFEWYDFGDELGGPTAVFDEVIRNAASIAELAPVTYFASFDVGWVPINGKFALFDAAIVYYDIYAIIGGGAIATVGDPLPAGTLAIGQRIFLTDFLALNIEVRDRLYVEPLPSGDTFTNIVTASLGLGIFLPPDFEYEIREPRILDWE